MNQFAVKETNCSYNQLLDICITASTEGRRNSGSYDVIAERRKSLIAGEKSQMERYQSFQDSGAFKSKEVVDFAGFRLDKAPPAISSGSFVSLETVSLVGSENELRSLPKLIKRFPNLTSIDLGSNHFKEIPSEVLVYKQLKSLRMFQNKIKKFPKDILKLTDLEELNLFDNLLTKTISMEALVNLREINLSGNEIPALPSFKGLRQLKKVVRMTPQHSKLIVIAFKRGFRWLSIVKSRKFQTSPRWMHSNQSTSPTTAFYPSLSSTQRPT